jgi:hypothetical protein
MRLQIIALREQRYSFYETFEGRTLPKSDLQVQFRLRGSDIGKLVRVGWPIPTEVTDDTGQSVILADTITPDRQAYSRVVNMTPEQLAATGWMAGLSFAPPTRKAAHLKVMRGTLKLTYADTVEELVIVNPLQYAGKTIEHPRLKELGIAITIVKPEAAPTEGAPAPSEFGLRIEQGNEKVRDASFCDAYLRPLFNQPGVPKKLPDGREYTSYVAGRVPFDRDMQLIIGVFPTVREDTLKWEINDLPLP